MADLDFDELDKAVNTLMAGVDSSKRNTALDEPEDKVVSLDVNTAEAGNEPKAEEPVVESPVEVAAEESTELTEASVVTTPVAPSSLATKRRGQFMDVMHPSSDMKVAAKPIRRNTTVLSPSTDISATTTSDPDPSPPLISEEVQTPAFTTEPLSSPFLPDAKPPKRPLGGVVTAEDTTETPAVTDTKHSPIDLDAEIQTPVAEPTVLPAELGSDILAVESNDLSGVANEPAKEVAQPIEPIDDIADHHAPEPSSVPAGGSIPQQYTEAPSTGDQTSGSIYDTANYHQAISAEATEGKKSSPLKWILLAVALLVVGGGVGIGYFFLTR